MGIPFSTFLVSSTVTNYILDIFPMYISNKKSPLFSGLLYLMDFNPYNRLVDCEGHPFSRTKHSPRICFGYVTIEVNFYSFFYWLPFRNRLKSSL